MRSIVQQNSRQRHITISELVRSNQLRLARIPRLQHLGRRCTPQDARVDEPREFDMGNVSAGAVDALEIPDGFGPSPENQFSPLIESWMGTYAEG